MAAKKKEVVVNTAPSVISSTSTGTVNIYVKVLSPEFASLSIDVEELNVEDTSCGGSMMDICSDGIGNILALTDQHFYNTIALLTKAREEYKKLKK